jgi:hypothetical protein
MTSRTTRLLRGLAVSAAGTLALGSLAPLPTAGATGTPGTTSFVRAAPASSAMVMTTARHRQRTGHCRNGGVWNLEVERVRRGRLHVEFEVDNVRNRQTWQVFVSDNGRRVAAVTRWSGSSGEFDLNRLTRNRSGRDRIAAAALNVSTGNRCGGRLRF